MPASGVAAGWIALGKLVRSPRPTMVRNASNSFVLWPMADGGARGLCRALRVRPLTSPGPGGPVHVRLVMAAPRGSCRCDRCARVGTRLPPYTHACMPSNIQVRAANRAVCVSPQLGSRRLA
eukprot:5992100-Prymnesium_polylepis.1